MSLRQNAFLLAVLAAALAIVGEWHGAAWLAHLWALPAGLLLLGLAAEALLLQQCVVRLTLRAPDSWRLAQTGEVSFVFAQDRLRLLQLEVALDAPKEFATRPRVARLTLAEAHEASVRLEATPRSLGRHAWPAPQLRISGGLQLAWWPRRTQVSLVTRVIPDLATAFDPRRAERAGGSIPQSRRGQGAELLQLRDYRAGDPLRAVDWKASARRGRLVSREYAEDQHLELILAIDAGRASGLGAGDVDRLSLYATVAARLAQRATAAGDAVGLVVFAAQPLAVVPLLQGGSGLTRIMDVLANLRVHPCESNPVVAAARIRALAPRRTLIVLLTDLEDPSAGEQLSRAVRLLAPKHLPLIAALESERVASLAYTPVTDALGAYRALAAQEFMSALEGNLKSLRLQGAAAVAARPAGLDRAVLQAYQEFRDRRRI